jgi:NhaP-type Na+/H+ or K+/H+ antiporter
MTLLIIFISLIFLYSLVSGRVERTMVTAPIIFTVAGAISFFTLPEVRFGHEGQDIFLTAAEIGLVLLLFSDAFRTDLGLFKDFRNLAIRLLSIGMLLTILLGGLAALLVFPNLNLWEAGILAAILAPTDAGLGQIIVTSPLVPIKIRQALNVEAGLNDGLSVPFMLFFMALAGGASGEQHSLREYVVQQLGYGAIIGIAIGLIGGWLLGVAHRRQWATHTWQQLGLVALPLSCMFASEEFGASMFIAAFVAGLAAQVGFKSTATEAIEFTEHWGQLFNLSIFFLFGLLVARDWESFTWRDAVYAALSLTIVRMLPVAIALVKTRLSTATVLFMGWFGPRGLASIVLGLVYLEQKTQNAGESTIRQAVMLTVLGSIFAHGLSALPGMKLYARKLQDSPASAPEFGKSKVEVVLA